MGKRKAPAKRRKKVALVCAGGGVTGAIYEMGCLRGLDELLDKSALDFDLYVGISGDRLAAARSRNDACLAACWDRTDRGRHSDRPFALGPAGHASPDRPGLSTTLGIARSARR